MTTIQEVLLEEITLYRDRQFKEEQKLRKLQELSALDADIQCISRRLSSLSAVIEGYNLATIANAPDQSTTS